MKVIEQYSEYNHYNYNNPIYIIVHYVGANSTAKNNADYFCGGDRQASAHEFVDDNFCYKVIRENQGAWHIGNSITEPNNTNSIGIEMCLVNGVVTEQTESNTLERVRYYMNKYNIPIENVRTHAEVTGYRKICPNWSENNWARWNTFKSKLNNKVNNSQNNAVEERRYDMKNLVCYCNAVDKRGAEYLADYLQCPCIDATLPFNYGGVAENIIAVGGDNPKKGVNGQVGFSGYVTKHIAGSDRYETVKEVLKFIGKL